MLDSCCSVYLMMGAISWSWGEGVNDTIFERVKLLLLLPSRSPALQFKLLQALQHYNMCNMVQGQNANSYVTSTLQDGTWFNQVEGQACCNEAPQYVCFCGADEP